MCFGAARGRQRPRSGAIARPTLAARPSPARRGGAVSAHAGDAPSAGPKISTALGPIVSLTRLRSAHHEPLVSRHFILIPAFLRNTPIRIDFLTSPAQTKKRNILFTTRLKERIMNGKIARNDREGFIMASPETLLSISHQPKPVPDPLLDDNVGAWGSACARGHSLPGQSMAARSRPPIIPPTRYCTAHPRSTRCGRVRYTAGSLFAWTTRRPTHGAGLMRDSTNTPVGQGVP
jgi:hypothetical protein